MNRDIRSLLNGIGLTFSTIEGSDNVLPEVVILEAVKVGPGLFKESSRELSLLKAWLKEYSCLLRTDVLKEGYSSLDTVQKKIMGGLISFIVAHDKSPRWQRLELYIFRDAAKRMIYLADKKYPKEALDKDFYKFGLVVRSMGEQPSRKILELHKITKLNKWIRGRVLFGVSPAADIKVCLLEGMSQPEQISSMCHCGKSSVYAAISSAEVFRDAAREISLAN